MKRIGVLLTLLVTLLAASSFALADDGDKGEKSGKKTGKCRTVSLKGTAGATTFTITVEKSNRAGRDLQGKPATMTFSGKVSVNARMCATAAAGASAASTFELRNLKVGKARVGQEDD